MIRLYEHRPRRWPTRDELAAAEKRRRENYPDGAPMVRLDPPDDEADQ